MRIIPALIVAAAALPVAANNIYKWTDAQGQTHYTQTPPPSGATTARSQSQVQPGVSMAAPAAPPPAPQTKKPETKPAAAAETKEAKVKRCTAAKERQAFLAESTPRRLMVLGADGSESRMTEEQYAETVTKAQEAGKGC